MSASHGKSGNSENDLKETAQIAIKPLLRGWSHVIAAIAALIAGMFLVQGTEPSDSLERILK